MQRCLLPRPGQSPPHDHGKRIAGRRWCVHIAVMGYAIAPDQINNADHQFAGVLMLR